MVFGRAGYREVRLASCGEDVQLRMKRRVGRDNLGALCPRLHPQPRQLVVGQHQNGPVAGYAKLPSSLRDDVTRQDAVAVLVVTERGLPEGLNATDIGRNCAKKTHRVTLPHAPAHNQALSPEHPFFSHSLYQ